MAGSLLGGLKRFNELLGQIPAIARQRAQTALLSLKRATQFLDLTRPCAACHFGFHWYRRAFGVDFGNLGHPGEGDADAAAEAGAAPFA